GQTAEWDHNKSLDWHLLQYEPHQGVFELVKALNHLYRSEPALYEHSFSPEGFEWIEQGDTANSVIAYTRKGHRQEDELLIILNLTPVVRYFYRCGLPADGEWTVLMNTDDPHYYGSGVEATAVTAEPVSWMNKPLSANLTLPPLGGLILKRKHT